MLKNTKAPPWLEYGPKSGYRGAPDRRFSIQNKIPVRIEKQNTKQAGVACNAGGMGFRRVNSLSHSPSGLVGSRTRPINPVELCRNGKSQ